MKILLSIDQFIKFDAIDLWEQLGTHLSDEEMAKFLEGFINYSNNRVNVWYLLRKRIGKKYMG